MTAKVTAEDLARIRRERANRIYVSPSKDYKGDIITHRIKKWESQESDKGKTLKEQLELIFKEK